MNLLVTIPKPQPTNEVIGKLEFIKIENFLSYEKLVKRMRRQATDWEKIFVKDTSDKEMLFKMYKKL
jgi:hypothetical protein